MSAETRVTVSGASSGFVQDVQMGRHRLTTDEPESLGGTDTGPAPYDLLLASLGSCTSMTISMYARRKNWPLESVRVDLRHSKVKVGEAAVERGKIPEKDQIERGPDSPNDSILEFWYAASCVSVSGHGSHSGCQRSDPSSSGKEGSMKNLRTSYIIGGVRTPFVKSMDAFNKVEGIEMMIASRQELTNREL